MCSDLDDIELRLGQFLRQYNRDSRDDDDEDNTESPSECSVTLPSTTSSTAISGRSDSKGIAGSADVPSTTSSTDIPSLGSENHFEGTCKRCSFFPKGRCTNGYDCQFCHYWHAGRKRKLKSKKKTGLAATSDENASPPEGGAGDGGSLQHQPKVPGSGPPGLNIPPPPGLEDVTPEPELSTSFHDPRLSSMSESTYLSSVHAFPPWRNTLSQGEGPPIDNTFPRPHFLYRGGPAPGAHTQEEGAPNIGDDRGPRFLATKPKTIGDTHCARRRSSSIGDMQHTGHGNMCDAPLWNTRSNPHLPQTCDGGAQEDDAPTHNNSSNNNNKNNNKSPLFLTTLAPTTIVKPKPNIVGLGVAPQSLTPSPRFRHLSHELPDTTHAHAPEGAQRRRNAVGGIDGKDWAASGEPKGCSWSDNNNNNNNNNINNNGAAGIVATESYGDPHHHFSFCHRWKNKRDSDN